MKNHIKIATLIMGGMLASCGSDEQTSIQKQQNMTSVIQEYEPGKYKVVEEYQSNQNRVILIDINGDEKLLSKAEIDALIQAENEKIQNGTSRLTDASMSSGGLSLGEAILASATGMIIGSWIGNKLFSNPNYQATTHSHRQEINRNVNSFKQQQATSQKSSKSSGFFGSKQPNSGKQTPTKARSSGFFGG